MANADDMLEVAATRAELLAAPGLSPQPRRKVAVLSCMDTRIDLFPMLGLERGDAHIVRNAGGLATDDALRSLATSQHIGTHDVMVVHHTHCGVQTMSDEELEALGATRDVDENVRLTMRRIREGLPKTGALRGFIYEVRSGRLREVAA